MDVADFDLKTLVTLRALLEEVNVTRAAERVELAQPSVSSALVKLRRQFHDELLVRRGRDYELTPFALQLLPQVQHALREIERVLTAGAAFDPATAERVFTFQCPDFAAIEVYETIPAAVRDLPGLVFDFRPPTDRPGTNTRSDLELYDFVVAPTTAGLEGESMRLWAAQYVCLGAAGNPALSSGDVTWEALSRLPMATGRAGRQTLTPAARRLQEMGAYADPVLRTDGLLALPSLLAGTDMIALVPASLADRLGPMTGTTSARAPFGDLSVAAALWWHPSRDEDPAHVWLRDVLADAVEARAEESPSGGSATG